MKNYYYILGLEQSASLSEIKTAYKALVSKFHPDVNSKNSDFFEKQTKAINEAYEVLSNSTSRSSYDRKLRDFLNNQKNNSSDSNYNKQREEELKRKEEDIRRKEAEAKSKEKEADKRQKQKEDELKKKEIQLNQKIAQQEKQKEIEKAKTQKMVFKASALAVVLILLIAVVYFANKEDRELKVNQVEYVEELAVEKENIANLNSEQEKINTEDAIIELPKEKEITKNDNLSEEKIVKQESKKRDTELPKEKKEPLQVKNNEELLRLREIEFDNVTGDDVEAFRANGKTGVRLKNGGKIVFEPTYDWIGTFNEGIANVKIKEKYGFIDRIGRLITPLQYDDVGMFSDGFASIKKNGKYGYINKRGEEVIPMYYDNAGQFKESLACVLRNGKHGFIDKTGNIIIPLEYKSCSSFSEGLTVVNKDKGYGIIDKKGNVILAMEYNRIYFPFDKKGLCQIQTHGGAIFSINKKGECVGGACQFFIR